MRTWLLVAAERREFAGILRRCGPSSKLAWPQAAFARQAEWRGDRWWFVANGPGRPLVEEALARKTDVDGIISTGFCGALDPALRVGDIMTGMERIASVDRVVVSAEEKRALRQKTGAAAVEMEAAAVARTAAQWGIPFRCVRVVSDIAAEDLPLDFNLYRDAAGRFSRTRIALAAMLRPFSVMPRLMRLDRNCGIAAEALGEFFANYEF
jgi:adenosylhomocysteine nucleosidase